MVAPKWLDSAFSGEGARLAGGRWNAKGVRMVYLASSLSLAALELLAHIDYERALNEFKAISVDFDESLLLSVEAASLPANWGENLASTQALGNAWVERQASALLAVPSRIVPVERNYLLNPAHPDADRIRPGEPRPFRYDPRVLKR